VDVKTYLVTVEEPEENTIIAGIYVEAESREEARKVVRRLLDDSALIVWGTLARGFVP
jgi:hypothetical protein